jgi:hypothetical protein
MFKKALGTTPGLYFKGRANLLPNVIFNNFDMLPHK